MGLLKKSDKWGDLMWKQLINTGGWLLLYIYYVVPIFSFLCLASRLIACIEDLSYELMVEIHSRNPAQVGLAE